MFYEQLTCFPVRNSERVRHELVLSVWDRTFYLLALIAFRLLCKNRGRKKTHLIMSAGGGQQRQ